MPLVLTSDVPSTPNQVVFDRIRASGTRPRVAWIPPFTGPGLKYFPRAQQLWDAFGVFDLEFCDIDEAPDERQLAALDRYDVIYFSGGNPIAFRRNILRTGLAARLREFMNIGRTIMAASGGSMQFTPNVSLYRLETIALEQVLWEHGAYDGLGFVDYELLPHANRFDSAFLEIVRLYSERVPHDILALADGAAILHEARGGCRCIGEGVRYRKGLVRPIESVESVELRS